MAMEEVESYHYTALATGEERGQCTCPQAAAMLPRRPPSALLSSPPALVERICDVIEQHVVYGTSSCNLL